jgi:cyanate permease
MGVFSSLLDLFSAIGAIIFVVLCFFFLGFWDGLSVIAVVAFVVLTAYARSEENKLGKELKEVNEKIRMLEAKAGKSE